ncbi:B2 bradykinin receptor-like [Dicentrarchus labrax]|uniref:G-protein coupled receptors family 1 profile domain-containing protein n=1 Tax=Dicentrarchus labrax TaxID=13489 RepID=A0A8C4H882_DICLA|nr:B2 bradykinin receptor-like [Dicentrarchus labrax]
MNLTTEGGMTLVPTSAPPDCPSLDSDNWTKTSVPVFILLITALGIVFNVFVLVVFWFHKKPCTVAEIYLSNLAAADLVLVSCLPFWAVNILNGFNWIFGLFLCKVVHMVINMNVYGSIYFLVLVSIDRFMALVHPLSKNRMRRPKYAKLACLLAWGLSLLLSVPVIIYRKVKPVCNITFCGLDLEEKDARLLDCMLTFFSFIIPICIVSCCTVKIIQALNGRLTEGLNQKTEHKATTLVLAVLLAFVICWLPFHLVKLVTLFPSPDVLKGNHLDNCRYIFTCLAFFNSVLNPILYVVVGKNFRKKVTELFKQEDRKVSFSTSCTRTSNLMKSVRE